MERLQRTKPFGINAVKPCDALDISELPAFKGMQFTVVRSSGEEDPGHELCLYSRTGYFPAVCTAVRVDELKGRNLNALIEGLVGKPLAAKTTCNSYTRKTVEKNTWRILLKKGKELGALRQLVKVRPDGMSSEEAVAWQEEALRQLEELAMH
jgi:hypothetical protein